MRDMIWIFNIPSTCYLINNYCLFNVYNVYIVLMRDMIWIFNIPYTCYLINNYCLLNVLYYIEDHCINFYLAQFT